MCLVANPYPVRALAERAGQKAAAGNQDPGRDSQGPGPLLVDDTHDLRLSLVFVLMNPARLCHLRPRQTRPAAPGGNVHLRKHVVAHESESDLMNLDSRFETTFFPWITAMPSATTTGMSVSPSLPMDHGDNSANSSRATRVADDTGAFLGGQRAASGRGG